jgi:hypothetical protein
MMISSITTGQLIARIGKYKKLIMTGIGLAAVSILALITLQPDSPYWHQAVIMALCGLGLGMTMPVLSLAVQNEFEQKDLGELPEDTASTFFVLKKKPSPALRRSIALFDLTNDLLAKCFISDTKKISFYLRSWFKKDEGAYFGMIWPAISA